jgi:hypothetical protein
MNDAEINATAQGMFIYLRQHCDDPMDALAVLICLFLSFYETQGRKEYPVEEFAKKLGEDLIRFWSLRTEPSEGTETLQ